MSREEIATKLRGLGFDPNPFTGSELETIARLILEWLEAEDV